MARNWALGLQGFGAGVQGRGLEFTEQLDARRKQAMLTDALEFKNALEAGRREEALEMLRHRRGEILRLNGNPADTDRVLGMMEAGDDAGALMEANTLLEYAYQRKLLERPPAEKIDTDVDWEAGTVARTDSKGETTFSSIPDEFKRKQKGKVSYDWVGGYYARESPEGGEPIIGRIPGWTPEMRSKAANSASPFRDFDPNTGQYTWVDDNGVPHTRKAEGWEQDPIRAEQAASGTTNATTNLSTELRVNQQRTPAVEKFIQETSETARLADLSAESAERAVAAFQRRIANGETTDGGIVKTVVNALADVTGSREEAQRLQTTFNKFRFTAAARSLKGMSPITDKDMERALAGQPPENAGTQEMESYLRGIAKLQRLDAAYNKFIAMHSYETRGAGGGEALWSKGMKSAKLNGATVYVPQVYMQMAKTGQSFDDVLAEWGIENPYAGVRAKEKQREEALIRRYQTPPPPSQPGNPQ